MSKGLETFEAHWANNQAYVMAFTPDKLQSAGFNKLKFGSLNLLTNVYTPVLISGVPVKYVLPNSGKQLSVLIEAQTGAGVDSTVVVVNYINQASTLHSSEIGIGEGNVVNREFNLPLLNTDTGILEVANANIIAGPGRSGTIAIRSPSAIIEDFQTNWGPADEGL